MTIARSFDSVTLAKTSALIWLTLAVVFAGGCADSSTSGKTLSVTVEGLQAGQGITLQISGDRYRFTAGDDLLKMLQPEDASQVIVEESIPYFSCSSRTAQESRFSMHVVVECANTAPDIALLKDINTRFVDHNSYPESFVKYGNGVAFTAQGGQNRSIWYWDQAGPPAQLIDNEDIDVIPGFLFPLGDGILFVENSAGYPLRFLDADSTIRNISGVEFSISRGTPYLSAIGDRVLLAVREGGIYSIDIESGRAERLYSAAETIYGVSTDGNYGVVHTQPLLWTDGEVIAEIQNEGLPLEGDYRVHFIDDEIVIIEEYGSQILRLDKTTGAVLERFSIDGYKHEQSIVIDDQLYLLLSSRNSFVEIWRSDGTQGGTIFNAILGAHSQIASIYADNQGGFYFVSNRSVWHSDTISSVLLQSTEEQHPDLCVVGTSLLFREGLALYRASHSSTELLQEGISVPDRFCTTIEDMAFFNANDGESGYEPWAFALATSQLRSIGNVNPDIVTDGSSPLFFETSSNRKLFSAYQSQDHNLGSFSNVWRTDGRSNGTVQLTSFSEGYIGNIRSDENGVYFKRNSNRADSMVPASLWFLEYNADDPRLLAEFPPLSDLREFAVIGERLVVIDQGRHFLLSVGLDGQWETLYSPTTSARFGRLVQTDEHIYLDIDDVDKKLARTDGVTLELIDLELPDQFSLVGNLGNQLMVLSADGLLVVDVESGSVEKVLEETFRNGVAIGDSLWFTIGRYGGRVAALAIDRETLEISELIPSVETDDDIGRFVVTDGELAGFTWPTPEGRQLFVTDGSSEGTVKIGPMETVINFCRIDQQLLLLGEEGFREVYASSSYLESGTLRRLSELENPRDISCLDDVFLTSADWDMVGNEPMSLLPDRD